MKKTLWMILAAMLMLMLAACNQTAEPVEQEQSGESTTKTKETEAKEQEEELTLEEVYKKTEEANKNVHSFESDMTMKQAISAEGEKQDINSDISLAFIADPMALHQQMTMSIEGQEQNIEAYLTKDGFYMYEPNQQAWVKLPEELSGQILQMSENQTNPSGQLEQLKPFVDEFDFQQDEKNYILTLKASGEKFDQFLKDQVKETLPPEMQTENMMGTMTFNKMEYELFIDKETFYLTAMNMVTDTDTEVEGQKVNMQMDIRGTYSNYNGVESIEVPKEALENAQEITMDQMNGQ
ncbi:DUF6612 family protein [Siminovitchia sediminis]|uniref:DUF6612 family protein n=1 Tax=Siminovitchia sediminis TaxID=1274353 RepID=A0ABW4KFP3_9BACI